MLSHWLHFPGLSVFVARRHVPSVNTTGTRKEVTPRTSWKINLNLTPEKVRPSWATSDESSNCLPGKMCSHGGCTCLTFFHGAFHHVCVLARAARAGYQHPGQKEVTRATACNGFNFLRGANRRDAMHRYLGRCDMSSVGGNVRPGDRCRGSSTDFASVPTFAACQKNKRTHFSLRLDLSLLCCCISRVTPV